MSTVSVKRAKYDELRLKLEHRELEVETLKSALAMLRVLSTQDEINARVAAFNAFGGNGGGNPTTPEDQE